MIDNSFCDFKINVVLSVLKSQLFIEFPSIYVYLNHNRHTYPHFLSVYQKKKCNKQLGLK